jgi:site-specific DNA-methyltransferase (adenine-specific)
MQIPINLIKVESRLRSVDSKKVDELLQSIQEIGLLNPITITKDNVLVAGAHRLEAMKRLGKDNIECNVLESVDKLRIELAEIDENLIRIELTIIERGDFLRNRKRVMIDLGLCSKNGGDRHLNFELKKTDESQKASNAFCKEPIKSFAKLTSEKTGLSERTINKDMDITKNLSIEVKPILVEMIKNKEITEKDIFNLNKLPKEKQITTVEKITSGKVKDVKDAINLIQKEEKKKEIAEQIKIIEQKQEDKNKLICGDALIELAKLPKHSIDLLITDPPYGIDYKSNRSEMDSHISKEGILNDGLDEAAKLLEDTMNLLSDKMKPDCHLYIFSSWQNCDSFRYIISQYFTIKNILIWDKGNHGSGDLKGSWGNRYECIIFATQGKREINCRKDDIISVAKINSSKLIHPTQKPWELITQLLEVSLQPGDVICDPFMGSGSTIKAIKNYPIPSQYIGIELDQDRFNQAKVFINE